MSTRLALRIAALASGAAILAAGVATAATADDQFGQHVRDCAQTIGLDGAMNPGMHQGYAGWSADHTC